MNGDINHKLNEYNKRKTERIQKFCNELAEIWYTNVPDWRFGQLMLNVLGQMQSRGRDPFFPEEEEMINFFRKYFEKEEK